MLLQNQSTRTAFGDLCEQESGVVTCRRAKQQPLSGQQTSPARLPYVYSLYACCLRYMHGPCVLERPISIEGSRCKNLTCNQAYSQYEILKKKLDRRYCRDFQCRVNHCLRYTDICEEIFVLLSTQFSVLILNLKHLGIYMWDRRQSIPVPTVGQAPWLCTINPAWAAMQFNVSILVYVTSSGNIARQSNVELKKVFVVWAVLVKYKESSNHAISESQFIKQLCTLSAKIKS